MADEKKPKIDLKARLGKNAAGGLTPPPPGAGAIPTPAGATPPATSTGQFSAVAAPAPTQAAPKAVGLPVPPGIPVGPPPAFKGSSMPLDPSNPLAAAMAQPTNTTRPAAAPPQPQRIEMDELSIQEARKGARKQGLIAGIVFGVVLGAVGYIAGGSLETSKGRQVSVQHAKSLAEDVGKSKEQLKKLADTLEKGRQTLGQRQFPDSLGKELSGINVDFDGSKLAGVRFSGFSTDTSSGLIEYISSVQSTNDHKNALIGLLARLQKPMAEALKNPDKAPPVNFVVLISKDSAKNPYGVLAPLQKPLDLAAGMPPEILATDPISKQNVTAPKFASLEKPGAAYVDPRSIEAACPSATTGQIGQLVSQLAHILTEIRGEQASAGDMVTDPKPGLLDKADRLQAGLNKVQ